MRRGPARRSTAPISCAPRPAGPPNRRGSQGGRSARALEPPRGGARERHARPGRRRRCDAAPRRAAAGCRRRRRRSCARPQDAWDDVGAAQARQRPGAARRAAQGGRRVERAGRARAAAPARRPAAQPLRPARTRPLPRPHPQVALDSSVPHAAGRGARWMARLGSVAVLVKARPSRAGRERQGRGGGARRPGADRTARRRLSGLPWR
jgi:hypothetical protein